MLLNEVEQKVMRLVEERGVAANKYHNVANKIVSYCEGIVESYGNLNVDETFVVNIPNSIAKLVDFIDGLSINVKITEAPSLIYTKQYRGTGNCEVYSNCEIENGKMKDVVININAYSFCGTLCHENVLTTLYHEINHAYECYCDVMKQYVASHYKNGHYVVDRFAKTSLKAQAANYYANNPLLYTIIYRLFSETEFNALVASVYGSLKARLSIRQNFHSDITKTKAYAVYNQIKKNYVQVFNNLTDDEIIDLSDKLSSKQIYIPARYSSVEGYRKGLIKKTTFLLGKLFKDIGRAASLYYDNAESNLDEIISTSPEPLVLFDD